MTKTVRARYTLEFKQEAVLLVTGGQSIAAAARSEPACGSLIPIAEKYRPAASLGSIRCRCSSVPYDIRPGPT